MQDRRGSPRLLRWLKYAGLYGVLPIVTLLIALLASIELTRYRQSSPQEGYLALTGATVLSGPELDPMPAATVLIRDGVIVEIAPDSDITIPDDAEVIELDGLYVMPGLIDMHVHLGIDVDRDSGIGLLQWPGVIFEYMRELPAMRRAFLEHGVTTVRSVGNDFPWVLDFRNQIDDGDLEGPRVFASGPVFTTREGHPVVTYLHGDHESDTVMVPESAQEARAYVRELVELDRPVDLIKIVQERGSAERGRPMGPIEVDVLEAIVDEAHRHGLFVTAHWGRFEDLEELLDAGVDGLEHIISQDLLDGWRPDLLERVVESEIPVTSTLVVAEVNAPADTIPDLIEATGAFHAAGGWLIAGSDAGVPGVMFGSTMHRELELLVEAGLSPTEALIAATVDAAYVLGTDEIGMLEPGRAADIVVLSGNPHDDIRQVQSVELVLRDGRLVFDDR